MTGINVSGTWKDIDACSVNVSGTWRTVAEIHANVSGTWKKVWPPLGAVSLDDPRTVTRAVLSPASATVYYSLNSNGLLYGGASTGAYLENWLDEPALYDTADYEVRFTHVSGTVLAGPYNTWLNLGTTRTLSMTQSVVGTQQSVLDVEIRPAGGGSVLTSSRVTMNAQVISGGP